VTAVGSTSRARGKTASWQIACHDSQLEGGGSIYRIATTGARRGNWRIELSEISGHGTLE
jgi:hypothetical protein